MNETLMAIRAMLQDQPAIALETLMTFQGTSSQEKRYSAYLKGWALYLLREWERSRVALYDLIAPVMSFFQDEEHWSSEDRTIITALRLGYAAVRLELYEDAERNLQLCRLALAHTKHTFLKFETWYLLAYVCLKTQRYQTSLRYTTYAGKVGGKQGLKEVQQADLHACRTFAHWYLGQFDKMRNEASAALALYEHTGKPVEQAQMQLCLAEWARQTKAPADTRRQALEEALRLVQLAPPSTDLRCVVEVSLALAHFFAEQGREHISTSLYYDSLAREAMLTKRDDVHLSATTLTESSRILRLCAMQYTPQMLQRNSLLQQARARAEQALALPLSEQDTKEAQDALSHVVELLKREKKEETEK